MILRFPHTAIFVIPHWIEIQDSSLGPKLLIHRFDLSFFVYLHILNLSIQHIIEKDKVSVIQIE